MESSRRLSVLVAALCLSTGCCSLHPAGLDDLRTPTVRTIWAPAGVVDLRAQFQPIFCRHVSPTRFGECDRWLAAPGVEGDEPSAIRAIPAVDRRALVIVPGILGECVADWVTPFSADYAELASRGYDVLVVPVEGRASAARNARIIDDFLSSHRHLLKDAVVVAYSKGATDFMHAATRAGGTSWLAEISVLVSVAGTVNGSPLASATKDLYRALLEDVPWATCEPSDGGGVSSIAYDSAMPVAEKFARAAHGIATYSVVAVADPSYVNPVLLPFHKALARLDGRNDGQVLMEDAILPGSSVLGLFRADHWSIALPFAESDDWQVAPLRHKNDFPREALIKALLEFTAPVTNGDEP